MSARTSRVPANVRAMRGFSLVEAMVGLALGLIVALAVMHSLTLFDAQKRTTTAGSEAQENGLVALALLEQDIHNAGSGLADKTPFDCQNYFTWYDDGTGATGVTKPDGVSPFDVVPVVIKDGGSGPDSITVQYATNFAGTLPTFLTATATAAANPYVVSRVFGINAGDVMLAVQGANCTLAKVSAIDATLSNLQHDDPGTKPTFNPGAATPVTWPPYTAGTRIFDLGQFVSRMYSISKGNLVVTEQTIGPIKITRTTTTLISNVVSLQAQYGITKAGATPGTQDATTVTQWVDATGADWGASPLTAANVKRIVAVRLAVVARSTQREAGKVTGTCTTDSGVVNNGPCAWRSDKTNPAPAIDLSTTGGGSANWQEYRYKTYQTVIPLRNVIWTFS